MDNEDILKLEAYVMDKVGAEVSEISKQRTEDTRLLNAYRKNPSPETFTPLYQAFKPLIYKAARPNTFGSPLPVSAHHAYAAQSFLESVRNFKSDIGAPFHIYAFGNIRNKGKRLNLKYQNIGYIPEARSTKYQLFNNAVTLLREQLGREPSALQIADEIKWSPKMVETMQKEIRKDLVMDESKAESFSILKSDKARQAFQDIQYSLIPAHQSVLEHAVGLNGREALTKPGGGPDLHAISRVTKLPIPKIRSALKTITRKYKQYQGYVLNKEDLEETEAEKEVET